MIDQKISVEEINSIAEEIPDLIVAKSRKVADYQRIVDEVNRYARTNELLLFVEFSGIEMKNWRKKEEVQR